MRVDITDVKLEAGSHKTVPIELTLDPIDIAGQTVIFDRAFTGHAEIWNVGDRLLVKATADGDALVPCSRCLSTVRLSFKTSLEEEFVQGVPSDQVEETAEDDHTISYYQGDEIDLTDPVRESILLELPMKSLCKPECKGLCPKCGTNRNEDTCTCETCTTVDPRLAALEQLLRKSDSQS